MTLPSSGPLSLSDIQGEFGGSNPIGMNEYYAGGGLVPSGTTGTYGAVPSSGALSIQNFYGTSNFVPVYVEDVFSTWLYAGNGASQTITNGINLSGSGGLVWGKNRTFADNHYWCDSARGTDYGLYSNNAFAQAAGGGTTFNSTGFTVSSSNGYLNANGYPFVSWTFRKQPKFFDIVTWTGTGASVPHNLGVVPGFVIVKQTNGADNWYCAHQSVGGFGVFSGTFGWFNPTSPSPEIIGVSTSTTMNFSGFTLGSGTYVAYLFASNAGGFGLTGSDNIITCGKYNAISGGSPVVTLGYEPQWIMIKSIGDQGVYGNWGIWDSMRGLTVRSSGSSSGIDPLLDANRATQEGTTYTETGDYITPTATGFIVDPNRNNWSINNSDSGNSYIYIAIRRGPMKVPTVGTTVYTPAVTGNDQTDTDMNFPIDVFWETNQAGSTYNTSTATRLSGNASMLRTSGSDNANGFFSSLFSNTQQNYYRGGLYGNSAVVTQYGFRRAPSFMDIVCYTGTGVARTINHNLGTTPQWIIVKRRSGTEAIIGSGDWYVYSSALGNDYFVLLNGGDSASNSGIWNYTSPTSSVFSVGTFFTNYSGDTYIAYLFATCPGVSKVGNYTGNGALRTIDCGFTTGARFILIRQWGSGGGPWYLWDSARGISSGNDPFNYLGTTLADVTNTNYVATTSVGFQLTAAAFDTVNTSGAPYIFLAIA